MPWSTLCVDQSQCLLPTPMVLAHKLTFASTSLPLPAPLSYCVPQVCLPHRSTLPKWQWVQLNCANGRKQGKKDALLPCPSHPVFFPLYNHLTEFCERNEQGVYHTLWWGAGPSENLLWSLFPEHTSSSVSALVSDGYHWDRNPKPLLIQKVESAHLSFTSLRFCKQLLTHNPAALSQHYMYFLINESKKKKELSLRVKFLTQCPASEVVILGHLCSRPYSIPPKSKGLVVELHVFHWGLGHFPRSTYGEIYLHKSKKYFFFFNSRRLRFSKDRFCGSYLWLHHFLAKWLWKISVISLSVHFHICKIGNNIPISWSYCEEWMKSCT